MYCQVVYICGCIPARIQHALADLPNTLDETYERTLREINKADWEFANRLFQFVSVASRPLRVGELAEILAFDFKAGPIPEFREDWRLEDPVDAVLSTCSTLLATVDGGESIVGEPIGNVIQFSHFSVKEFLTSPRLAESSDIITRRYHISMTPAHTLAAQACLGLLLHLDKDVITRDSLKEFCLAVYAAEHWADHVQLGDVSRSMEDGMKQLLDPGKPHLAACIWIHDPGLPVWEQVSRTERPLLLRNSPLHYATLWRLPSMVEFLIIEHLLDVNSRGFASSDDSATPLDQEFDAEHIKGVSFLPKCDANVTIEDERGVTPLHSASGMGDRKIAGILLERGADVAAQDQSKGTPLHWASRGGHMEMAIMLIERGADVTAQSFHRETPLHLAAQSGRVEVAGLLIERGADVAAQSVWGTPLHVAAHSGQVKVVRLLINRGADVAAQTENGDTPLHNAMWTAEEDLVVMLIERGADVAAKNVHGETPLHVAVMNGPVAITGLIIKLGADVTAQRKDGDSPLHLASRGWKDELVAILIEHGADVDAQNKKGETPLHPASDFGQVGAVSLLLGHGADAAAQSGSGDTPLHFAAGRGNVQVAGMLIEHGADVTARNKNGSTPLHLVSSSESWFGEKKYADFARILLECGADVTAQDNDGQTPFDLASSDRETAEVAHVLSQHGVHGGHSGLLRRRSCTW